MIVTGPGGDKWPLAPCPGKHPQFWSNCNPKVRFCHWGLDEDAPDYTMGDNRVLAYLDLMMGTTLVESTDIADIDSSYRRGRWVARIHVNDSLFVDDDGTSKVLYAVTILDGQELNRYVALVDDLQTAREVAAPYLEP